MRRPFFVARLAALAALSLLAAGLLGSCAWWQIALGGAGGVTALSVSRLNHLYGGPHHRSAMERLPHPATDVRLAFIECDDHGWLFSTDQARAVLDTIQALTGRSNVAVVLYIHGWRHNASANDHDVKAFVRTISYLGERLQQDDFRGLRLRRTGDPGTTIVGIYVGWRGKLSPELPVPLGWVNLPVYASFWNRKAAAHVVGRGDLREFLLHLDDLFEQVNQRSWRASAADRSRGIRPRMSLVTIGHSFGGHVLFDATRDRLEGHLFQALSSSGADTAALSGRLYPARGENESAECLDLVRGFGDLVVLINPAIEAASYRRIDELVHSTRFRPTQVPVLITVSADNDWARGSLFASARGLSMVFVRRSSDQRPLLGHALGTYAPQVTHRLELRDRDAETRRRAQEHILARGSPGPAAGTPVALASARPMTVPDVRQGFEPEQELVRLTAIEERFDRKPAYVILSSRDVISGHSDFFRVGFVSWLSSEVLKIQRRNLEQDPGLMQQAK